METIKLENREVVDLGRPPDRPSWVNFNRFGVALDNEEALAFISRGLRVSGDNQGPYLIVRVPRGQKLPRWTGHPINIEIVPRTWIIDKGGEGKEGVVCWAVRVDEMSLIPGLTFRRI